jgi:hypothetical protein
MTDRVKMAQKVADIVLKNYSPVTLANGKMDDYANDYVISDPDRANAALKIHIDNDEQRRNVIYRATGKYDTEYQKERDRKAEEARIKAEEPPKRRAQEEENQRKAAE